MKNSDRRKSRRSPFVRFVRGVLRLFKVLFRPKQKNLKSAEDYQNELRMAELDRRSRESEERRSRESEEQQREQLITVGELFGRIKWQDAQSTVLLTKPVDITTTTRSRDASLN